jgi:hypothetical protein
LVCWDINYNYIDCRNKNISGDKEMIKQIISILMLLIFVSPASAWWDDDWNYRREIIINHSMVNHTQSNFPIMIQITTSGLNDNGTDARFTDSNDNELAREIEYYNSTSKVLTAFFNVTTLSNTSDTIIYLYSGNPSASGPAADSTYGSQAVWSNDYFDINLMADTSDSTGEGNTLSLVGTPTVGDMDYGKGYVLNGGTDYLRLTANADMRAMDYTTIKFSIDNSDASIQRIITWHDSTNGGEWNIKRETSGEIKFAYITGGVWAYKTILVSYVVDQEYIITLSKTDGTTMAIYLDGSLVDIVINMEQDGGYGAQHFYIGASHIGTQILNGNIAILYLGGIIKFENYIITIHNNLNNPTTTGTAPFFLSFGSEEHCPKIPPNPTNLDHTKGFFWVNHTWEAGTGNITDSYNVSHNSVWYNNTINSYYYSGDIGDGGYSEILIYAYNNSGFLSEEYVTQNISAPPYITIYKRRILGKSYMG